MVVEPPQVKVDDFIASAFALLPWPPQQLMEARLRSVLLAMHGARNARDASYRQQAELVRLQTVDLLNIQLDRKNKIKDAAKLWRFPWDEQPATATEITPEQAAEQLQRLVEHSNRKHNEQHPINA